MTSLLYTDDAVAALATARPVLVDVVPARELVPFHADGGVTHAGPPIEVERMCGPMRAAISTAAFVEGLAASPAEALAALEAGEIPVRPNHDCGGVGPMSGAVTGSMPVLVATDQATGNTAWCPLNEGSGKVLRYGADDEEVVDRLRWMRDELGPSLARALASVGPLDLIEVQREAIGRGDEAHHRTEEATAIVAALLEPHVPAEVTDFVTGNGQFFLNVAMVSAKVAMLCAAGVPGSSLLTVIARNGVEVGIQLSGTGERWFVGDAALPAPAALYPGHDATEMCRDLGDSAIVEVYGLGALAVEASPLSAPSVGLDVTDSPARMTRFREIAAGEHPSIGWEAADGARVPAILGVDARKVLATGTVPPIHTGIAHREPGVGQIGGGITLPPMSAFEDAVAALDQAA